jgi:hypothetical protein
MFGASTAIDDAVGEFVLLVPGGESCHHYAGVNGDHRRVRSRVSLTSSAVSTGGTIGCLTLRSMAANPAKGSLSNYFPELR